MNTDRDPELDALLQKTKVLPSADFTEAFMSSLEEKLEETKVTPFAARRPLWAGLAVACVAFLLAFPVFKDHPYLKESITFQKEDASEARSAALDTPGEPMVVEDSLKGATPGVAPALKPSKTLKTQVPKLERDLAPEAPESEALPPKDLKPLVTDSSVKKNEKVLEDKQLSKVKKIPSPLMSKSVVRKPSAPVKPLKKPVLGAAKGGGVTPLVQSPVAEGEERQKAKTPSVSPGAQPKKAVNKFAPPVPPSAQVTKQHRKIQPNPQSVTEDKSMAQLAKKPSPPLAKEQEKRVSKARPKHAEPLKNKGLVQEEAMPSEMDALALSDIVQERDAKVQEKPAPSVAPLLILEVQNLKQTLSLLKASERVKVSDTVYRVHLTPQRWQVLKEHLKGRWSQRTVNPKQGVSFLLKQGGGRGK